MTRKIDALLEEYGESHQNPTNKAVHWICVPVIVWTVAALVWSLPVPAGWSANPYMTWLSPVLAGALVYYIVMSWQLAIGFAIYAAICFWAILKVDAAFETPVWQIAIVVFVIAWIGQFWGHKVEGKKPSFFKDVQFLLIGPAWLLHFLYRRAGISY